MGRNATVALPHRPDCFAAAGIVGAWAHDMTDNRVVADPGVAQLFGVACPDAANGDLLDHYLNAIHPADRIGFASEVEAASRCGRPIALQYRVRTSGGVRWVHDYGSFTLDEGGRPWRGHGIVIDATWARRDVEAVEEIAARVPPDAQLQGHIDLLAEHVIAASEIARTLPSARLRALTDPLLWEVGRLLAWVTAKRRS